ncbi:UNVERIFIED_CONTAM: hypothetical protein GTU68_050083 [Idotea baltica]|nr:hypothetical protein [Idotea baltica]
MILVLSISAIFLLLIKIWRSKRSKKPSLERDKTGYWRYHKTTQYLLKAAYAKQLKEESEAENEVEASEETSADTKKKLDKKVDKKSPVVAVLDFDGDIKAKQHDDFALLVDEIVLNQKRFKEVVVKITSPGGAVPHYGHVFAEMKRLRAATDSLTVCVDVVAASGGYLAALPAHKIIAAPFAMVGSIGVVAFVPNIRRLLQRIDITPRTFTAGKFKRTVSLTDEATKEEVDHFKSQLEAIHRLFLAQAHEYRPNLDFDLIETGDSWTAAESIEREIGLVDSVATSQEYLLSRNAYCDVLYLSSKKGFLEDGFFRFGMSLVQGVEQRVSRYLHAAA